MQTPSYAISQTDGYYATDLASDLSSLTHSDAGIVEIKRKYSFAKLSEIASDHTGELVQKEISWINGQISMLKSCSNPVMFIFTLVFEDDEMLSS